jgi:hypothetical protein
MILKAKRNKYMFVKHNNEFLLFTEKFVFKSKSYDIINNLIKRVVL